MKAVGRDFMVEHEVDSWWDVGEQRLCKRGFVGSYDICNFLKERKNLQKAKLIQECFIFRLGVVEGNELKESDRQSLSKEMDAVGLLLLLAEGTD